VVLTLIGILNPRRLAEMALSKLHPTPYTFDERFKTVKYERCALGPLECKYEISNKTFVVDDYPPGYPQLAAFLNLDPNFPVYRRFGTLRHRLMVHKEVELMKLEQNLNEMDKADWTERRHRLQSIRRDHEDATKEGKEQSEREKLIDEIDKKLERYGMVLNLKSIDICLTAIR